jgi:hypothetical protein
MASTIGVTQDGDMYTFRKKKSVIRIQVGITNRELLPYSTVMFGTKGFD